MRILLAFVGIIFLWNVFSSMGRTPAAVPAAGAAQPEAPKEDPKLVMERGTAALVATKLRDGSKNPASFKLESLLLFQGGDACYEFRGTNSFNAIVPGKAVYVAKTQAVLTEREPDKFRKAWNSVCTKAGGKEISAAVRMYIL